MRIACIVLWAILAVLEIRGTTAEMGIAVVLGIAAILETLRLRWAALLGLAASAGLWIYYGAGLGDRLISQSFASNQIVAAPVPWLTILFLLASTVCSALLTTNRYSRNQPPKILTRKNGSHSR
jgi:hypothetical protein